MKIINFISVLLVITICFAMCFMVGCKSNDATSDDISSVKSELTKTLSSETTDETDATTSTENVSDSSENDVADDNAGDSNVSETPSEPANTPSNPPVTSTPTVSTPTETPSEDTPAVDNSKPTDAIVETPTYPIIKLEVPTTYYGYKGYFTLNDNLNDIHLVELGLASDNLDGSIASTEYCDIVTGKTLGFVFASTMTEYKDLLYNHVFVVGVGTTKVEAIY